MVFKVKVKCWHYDKIITDQKLFFDLPFYPDLPVIVQFRNNFCQFIAFKCHIKIIECLRIRIIIYSIGKCLFRQYSLLSSSIHCYLSLKNMTNNLLSDLFNFFQSEIFDQERSYSSQLCRIPLFFLIEIVF